MDIIPRGSAWRLEGLKIDYEWRSCQDIRSVDAPYIIHTAAIADVPYALTSPIATLSTNVLGTAMLMEACARHDGFERIVIQSSESVYGYAKRVPIPEEEPLNPSSVYGASKAAQEMVGMAYRHSHRLPVTVIRSSTLFGPEMRMSQVVPIFLRQAFLGEPITVHGDGHQSRDMQPVDNLVDGILLALTKQLATGQVFNIASGNEVTINQIARTCIELTNSRSPIIHTRQRPGEQDIRLVPDITKARTILGYEPRISFQEGMTMTAQWMSRLLGIPLSSVPLE